MARKTDRSSDCCECRYVSGVDVGQLDHCLCGLACLDSMRLCVWVSHLLRGSSELLQGPSGCWYQGQQHRMMNMRHQVALCPQSVTAGLDRCCCYIRTTRRAQSQLLAHQSPVGDLCHTGLLAVTEQCFRAHGSIFFDRVKWFYLCFQKP